MSKLSGSWGRGNYDTQIHKNQIEIQSISTFILNSKFNWRMSIEITPQFLFLHIIEKKEGIFYMNYTLREDKIDERDYKFSLVLAPTPTIRLPKTVDLRNKMPAVYNQLNWGSCTANAGCGYMSYRYKRPFLMFSRLYLYYKERLLEGTVNEDNGATMRSIAKALNQFGVCKEEYMPYNPADFAKPPTNQAEINASKYKINSYHSLNTLDEIKQCLALRQQPILLGMRVYKSFESDYTKKTGKMTMPTPNDEYLGNHAVLVVGYYGNSLKDGYLIVRNSWGEDWGQKGYFSMPYKYVNGGYAFSYWTLF